MAKKSSLPTLTLFLLAILSMSGSFAAADQACEDECSRTYWECSDNCGPFGGALCEQQCSDAANTCFHRCSNCPSTREYTESTFEGYGPTGRRFCLKSQFANHGAVYDEVYQVWKNTRYRRTDNCDGSHTTTVLGVSYDYPCCCYLESLTRCSPYGSIQGLCLAH